MNILENELVKKYFGYCECHSDHRVMPLNCSVHGCPADRILKSMHEPIKIGDSFLWIGNGGQFVVRRNRPEMWLQGDDLFHPYALRLPDRFQKAKTCDATMETSCPSCHEQHVWKIDRDQKPYDGFNPNPGISDLTSPGMERIKKDWEDLDDIIKRLQKS